MNNILVTGPNGFIGRRLCNVLVAKGYCVRRAVRNYQLDQSHCALGGAMQDVVEVGDINGSTSWCDALRGIDVVVHLAARVHVMHEAAKDPLRSFREVNVDGTKRLAVAASSAGVKRVVYISSVKVNGESTVGRPFTEKDNPEPKDAYGISKMEAERVLIEASNREGFEHVIIRPALVYGPGVVGNFARILRLVRFGVPLPFASIQNMRSMVGIDNLTDLIATCTDHPRAAGQIFLAADGEDVSTPELVAMISRAMNKKCRVCRCSPFIIKMIAQMIGYGEECERLIGSLQVDVSKVKSVLGWSPQISMKQGIQDTVHWYLHHIRG